MSICGQEITHVRKSLVFILFLLISFTISDLFEPGMLKGEELNGAGYLLNRNSSSSTLNSTIEPGRIYYNNGNFGIGTQNPKAGLEIQAATNPWFSVGRGGQAGRVWIEEKWGSPWIILSDGDGPPRIQFQQLGSFDDDDYYENWVWFGMSGPNSSNLSINGGNLGIGHFDPKTILQVLDSTPVQIRLEESDQSVGLDVTHEYINDTHYIGFTTEGDPGNWLLRVASPTGDTWLAPGGGNVGVGTPAPDHTLSVKGSIQSLEDGFVFPDGSTQITAANHYLEADIISIIQANGFLTSVTNADLAENINFANLTIAKADIVGLGIPGENTQLTDAEVLNILATSAQIQGASLVADEVGIRGRDDIAGDARLLFKNEGPSDSYTWCIWNDVALFGVPSETDVLRFDDDGGRSRLVINQDGNVGIGTTVPEKRLHIQGDAGSSSTAQLYIDMFTDTKAARPEISGRKSHTNALSVVETLDGEGLLQITGKGVDSSGAYRTGASIYMFQDGAAGSNFIPGQIYFSVNDTSGTYHQALTIRNNGNVGIGETNPTALLHIESDSLAYFRTNSRGADTDALHMFANTNQQYTMGLFGKDADDNVKQMFQIKDETNNKQYLIIEPGSSTGILENLSVSGVDGGNGDSALFLADRTNSFAKKWIIWNDKDLDGTSEMNVFRIGPTVNDATLGILQNGNIGIGTVEPNALLHIESDSEAYFRTNSRGADTNALHMFANTDQQYTMGLFAKDADDNVKQMFQIKDETNNAPFLVKELGGPSHILENLIISGANGGNGDSLLYLSDRTNSFLKKWVIWSDKDLSGTSEMHVLRIGPTTTDTTFTILQNGNVGIGTTTPEALLEVNGTIKAQEVNVPLVNWADHVFEEDYNLRSIPDLKRFIQTKKHLPDVPSEDQLKHSGLSIAKIQQLQMQKIEENVLYILNLHKENQELRQMVEEQNQRINALEEIIENQ